MADDYSATIDTTGTVTVGGSATGNIETSGDRDWFAVELVAGRTYRFDLGGSPTGEGTLSDTFLRRILDAEGNKSHGDGAHRTYNDDFEGSRNSRVTFTATESGTYYVETSGDRDETGTYTLSVTDVTPVVDENSQENEVPTPADADSVRTGATDLGDITDLDGPRFPTASLDGDGDRIDYYRFTLSEAKEVGLGLRQQDANADLFVEDAEGTVLHSGAATGTANEWVSATLLAGTYYIRVEAQATGDNDHRLRYGVSEAGPAMRVADAEAEEGEDAVARFRVTLDSAATAAVTVSYTTADGTAVAGSDYEATSGTLTFAAGEREKWVEVSLVDDEEEDSGETFTLRLSGASGAYLADAEAVGTILNTEVLESVSEGDTDLPATTATTGRVVAGESATGNIAAAGDQDWFAVTLEAGTAYWIDLLGSLADGGTLLDPYLRGIYDSEGTLVSGTENDNRSLFYYSSRVEFMPDADGTYYIAAGANGSHTGTYTLSVEGRADDYAAGTNTTGAVAVDGTASGEIEYGGDSDWFAVTLEAGKTYQFDLEGARTKQGTLRDPYLRGIHDSQGHRLSDTMDINSGVGGNSRVVFTADADGTYYVAAGGTINKTGTYRLSVADVTDDYTADTQTTGSVAVGGTASGEVALAHDRDWFAVELEADKLYRIKLQGADTGHGTLSDPRLDGVYDSQGNLLSGTTDDNGGTGRNSVVDFAPPAAGTYYVAADANGAEIGTYRLDVALSPWEVEVSDAQANEVEGTMRFRVGLNWASPTPVTVRYETVDGTAVAGSDYEASSGTVTFAAGETEKWVQVRLYDDFVKDNGETFTLRLSDASGAAVVDAEALGTILNTERTTRTIAVDSPVTGKIAKSGEIDWFAVTLEAEQTYRVDMQGFWSGNGTLIDPRIRAIHDSLGNELPGSGNDDREWIWDHDSRTFFTPETAGIYYIETSDGITHISIGNTVLDKGTYRFSVTTVADDDYGAAPRAVEDVEDVEDPPLQPGSITVGGSVDAEIEVPEDRDWFAVTLEAGKTYRFDMAGKSYRPNLTVSSTDKGTLGDPYIRGLYDSEGSYLGGTSNDNVEPITYASKNRNAAVHFTPEEAGTYYVAASGNGNHTGTYRVSVTEVADDYLARTGTTGTLTVGSPKTANIDYPGDTDWFAVTLEAGNTYRVDLKSKSSHISILRGLYDSEGNYLEGTAGDNNLRDSRVFFTAESDGTYYVAATAHTSSYTGANTGPYELSVTDVTSHDHYSADTQTTGSLTVGGSATGDINWQFDRDWFAVTLEGGEVYRIDLEGYSTNRGTLYDPYLYGIHDSDGNLLAGTTDDDGGSNRNSRVWFESEESGTYYIEAGGDGSSAGTYRVAVTEPSDDYTADTETTGAVAVDGSATGEINWPRERDWFAVTLEAGTLYRIDLQGRDSGHGTLYDPYLYGIHDSDGNLLAGTTDDYGGWNRNSRVWFEPEESGTYYVAAGGDGSSIGTYRVSVKDASDDYTADTQTTGSLTVGGSATGEINRQFDRDWFAVTLEAGSTYRIDMEASSTNRGTLYKPYLHGIHDSDGSWSAGTTREGVRWENGGALIRSSRVYFEPEESGTHYIDAGVSGSGIGTYRVAVTDIPDDEHTADTQTTGAVTVGGSVNAEIGVRDDRDWFAVTLEGGKPYRVDLEGYPTNRGTLYDPYLYGIHDSNGNLLAGTADDNSGRVRNSAVHFEPEESGTYYIAAGGDRGFAGTYRLSVADTSVVDDYAADTNTTGTVAVGGTTTGEIGYPNDRDWFAVTMVAGTHYWIELEGYSTNLGTLRDPYLRGVYNSDGNILSGTQSDGGSYGHNSLVVFTPDADGTYYVAAGGNRSTGTYRLSVTAMSVDDDYTADTGTTGVLTVGGSATGEIERAFDHDWFAVTLEGGKVYQIDLEGKSTDRGTLLNPVLRGIHDADGTLFARTTNGDGGTGRNSRVTFTPDEDATYYVAASDFYNFAGTYRVSVQEVEDAI